MTAESSETLFEFPCDFPIKAFGHGGSGFEAVVAAIVQRHVPGLGVDAISTRASSGGKFTAVTVVIRAESKAQVDAIYLDLTRCSEVLMAL